jgi:hypothetical protein
MFRYQAIAVFFEIDSLAYSSARKTTDDGGDDSSMYPAGVVL